MTTRSLTQIYLLGTTITELTGTKLPSIVMALRLFFHHHLVMKQTVRVSSTVVVTEVSKFWHKARIPIQDSQHCQVKLERLFEEWRLLKKGKGRRSDVQKERENAFKSKFNDLFDIAHANALGNKTIDEDRDFLLAQRERGRRGSMAGIDSKVKKKEKRAVQKRNLQSIRHHKMTERL